jgi:hypothetical protein
MLASAQSGVVDGSISTIIALDSLNLILEPVPLTLDTHRPYGTREIQGGRNTQMDVEDVDMTAREVRLSHFARMKLTYH